MSNGLKQINSLTSLRFFAAMAVVLHHGAIFLAPNQAWRGVFKVGYVGVSFFFVLSGFVLARSFAPELPIRFFYGRRFARVYPLHVATAILAIPAILYCGSVIVPQAALANILLLQGWVPFEEYNSSLNGVSWSLSCEAFFYAVFPFVVRPLAADRNPARMAITIVLAMIFASVVLHFSLPREITEQIVYKNPLFRFGEFAIGILLASNVEKLSRFNNIPVALAGFAICVVGVGVFVWVMAKLHIPVDRDFADIVMLPATAFLIVSTASSDLAGRASLLRSPALVLLGRASFALYMMHSLLLQVTAAAIGKSYVAWVLATLASVLLSLLTFKLVEEPVETWLRARIGNPRPSLVPA